MSRNRLASLLSLPVVAFVGAFIAFSHPHATAGNLAPQAQQGQQQPGVRGNLKIINNPGGGQIVYGPLVDQSTMGGAMYEMLHSVHGHFGEKPQIGDFFKKKGSNSVATFFTLNAKKQGGGTVPITGMVIVSMDQGSKPIGAVLYDDSAHFSQSQPVMMRTLDTAWHTSASPSFGGSSSSMPVTLRQATGGDRSASIGLPPGWQITNVAGGFLSATGPNGEFFAINGMFQQIHDPRSMNQGFGGGRGPMLVAPMQGDLFSSYVSLVNQSRQSQGKPPANFHLISSQKVGQQAIQAFFQVDGHDGKGMRKGNVRLDPLYTRGVPTWALSYTVSNAPETVYAAQTPVMAAMYKSYSQDRNVIGREQQAVLNGIAAAGERSKAQAAAADQRREASSAAFTQHRDDINRNSKAFQNYILDRSQLSAVGSNGLTYHGTVGNNTAAALVAAYPNQFQIVPPSGFIKGPDF